MYNSPIINDHYKNPRNTKELENPDFCFTGSNPLCGDKIKICFSIKNGIITEISQSVNGCILSQTLASITTELVLNKNIEFIKSLTGKDLEEIIKLKLGPNRMECAILALKTIQKAVQNINLIKN